jgi:hypothetical protein
VRKRRGRGTRSRGRGAGCCCYPHTAATHFSRAPVSLGCNSGVSMFFKMCSRNSSIKAVRQHTGNGNGTGTVTNNVINVKTYFHQIKSHVNYVIVSNMLLYTFYDKLRYRYLSFGSGFFPQFRLILHLLV